MSAWYMVILDIITKNVKLHLIRLKEADDCKQCGSQDTVLYRLTEHGVRE